MKHKLMLFYILRPFGAVRTEAASKGPFFVVLDNVLTVVLGAVATIATMWTLEPLDVLVLVDLPMRLKTGLEAEFTDAIRTLKWSFS